MPSRFNATKKLPLKRHERSLEAMKRIQAAYVPANYRPAIKVWNLVWPDLEDAAYWSMLRFLFNLYCHIPDLQQMFLNAFGLREVKDFFKVTFMRPDEGKAFDDILKMPSIEIICWFPQESYQERIVWFLSHAEYLHRVKDLPGVVIPMSIDTKIIDAFVSINGLDAVVITNEEFHNHIYNLYVHETTKPVLL